MRNTLLTLVIQAIAVVGQTPCCVQENYSDGVGCTTVDWCNQAQTNCEGPCEGQWTVVGGGGCTALGETCQPTSPVRCCEPYVCTSVDVNLNLGTCGAPGTPTAAPPPSASPPPPPPPPPPAGNVRKTYFFGHSLIYHTFTSYPNYNDLSVPFWLHLFGATSGESWLADGEFRTNNYPLPASPDWGWTPDITGWSAGQGGSTSATFATSAYDSVVYTELNYVQYKGPNEPYDYNDLYANTPVESLVRIIDYVQAEAGPDTPIYLYECWQGMNTFPPSEQQKMAYYASQGTDGVYHDWWVQLHAAALGQRPNANLVFVPVAPILAALLETFFGSVPFDALFEDGAPHGRPTPYFLAALIQYVAMTGGGPDPSYALPTDGSLHPEVAGNYGAIVDTIVMLLSQTPTTSNPVSPVTSAPVTGPEAGPVASPVASPVSSPISSGPNECCIQADFSGGVDCTTVDWCNQLQANCEGDCQGVWRVVAPSPPVASPVASPVEPSPVSSSPVASPVDSSPVTTSPVEPPVGNGNPCCIQAEIAGEDACTTVDWCNQLQANCEGDCEGVWRVVAPSSPVASPVASPVEPSPVTTSPVASPVDPSPVTTSPVEPPVDNGNANACCIQAEFSGGVDCTTVDWCNQLQANCEGDCEGVWRVVAPSSPVASPVASPVEPSPVTTSPVASPVDPGPVASPVEPPVGNGNPCCIQENFSDGTGCTTVDWCNQAQGNCEGSCEGRWTAPCKVEGDACVFSVECCSGSCLGNGVCENISRKLLRARGQ